MTVVDVQVRRALPADDGELTRLAHLASLAIADERGGAILARRELAVFELTPDRSDGAVLLGSVDGVIVAYAALDHAGADGVALLQAIFVEPDARSLGVGEALMSEVLSVARAAGATSIDARALPGDRETKNFYETHGLVARLIVVNRTLT